jgi:diguanylate cyclase (GGDEF)-like protein
MLTGICFILVISMNMVMLKRKTYPGFGWWTVGVTTFGVSCLILPLRNIIPDIFSIVLANVLFVLAALLFWEGTRIFLDKGVRKLFIFLVLIIYTIFQSYFTFVDNEPNIRSIVVSFILGTIYGLTALEFLLKIRPCFRLSYWFTGSLFAIFSIYMFVHGLLTLILHPSQDLLAPGIMHSLTFMMIMFLGIGWTIRFIVLNGERLERELKNTQLQLQKMATTDFLTGISNYRLFLESGEREIQRSRRYKGDITMLMIDLDYFKKINDNYGHAAGDKVLIGFADICKKNLRDIDIFGRLGGEEFAIILPQTSISEGKILAERLCATVAQSDINVGDKNLRITISIGVSALFQGEDKLDAVLKRADDAMYEAKRNGRNQVAITL